MVGPWMRPLQQAKSFVLRAAFSGVPNLRLHDRQNPARLVAIEKDVALIRQKQDEFTKHYATKADLTEAKNNIIVWVVAAVFLAQLLPVVGGLVKQFFR